MATPVDQLIVEIRAETAGLRKGLNQVNKQLGSVNKSARASLLTFSNLSKVLAGVGLAKFVSGVVTTSRTFEDLRATIQANTGDLQETNKAFEDILDFTKTTTFQIEEVTRAFIEFRRLGVSMTRKQMEGIGNVAAAQNKSIDEMAKAIFRASTTSMESLQLMGFTGERAGDMITLRFGEKGVAGTIEETFKNTTENVIDFVTKVGEVNFETAISDRLNTLTGSFSNLTDKVSIFQNAVGEAGLNQSLIRLSTTFQDVLADTSGKNGLAEMLGMTMAKAVDTLNSVLEAMDENIGKVILGLQALGVIATVMVTKAIFGALASAMGTLAVAMTNARKAIVATRTALIGLMATAMLNPVAAAAAGVGVVAGAGTIYAFRDEILGAIEDVMTEINAAFEGLGQSFLPEEDGKDPMTITITEGNDAIKERLKTLTDLRGEIEAGTVGIEDMTKAQDLLTAALADGTISQEQANALYQEFLEATGPVGKAMAEIGERVKQISDNFADNFVNALMEGQNALETFKDMSKQIVAAIISTFMKLLVIQPIVDAILGSFGISAPRTGSGLSTGGAAGGGTIQANRPVLVGERGPEIFMPNTGGTVLNNMNSRNAMGGGGVTVVQNNNFALGVGATARAEVQKMLPQIAETSKMAVFEAAARGGAYRKGLLGGT